MNTPTVTRSTAADSLPLYQAETLESQAAKEYDKQNWQSAEMLLQQALKIRQSCCGRNEPGSARLLDKIGLTFFQRGLLDQAGDAFKQAEAALQAVYYPGHGLIAPVLEHQADVLWKQGAPGEAAQTLKRAQEIYAKTETMENRDTLRTMLKLARLYLVLRQPEQVEAIIDKAMKHVDTPLGPVAEFRYHLALAYLQEGKTREASGLFKACIEQFRQRHNYARVVDCMEQLNLLDDERQKTADLEKYRALRATSRYPTDIFFATLLRA